MAGKTVLAREAMPDLDIDAYMAKEFGHVLSANAKAERAEVWRVLCLLEGAGWAPACIDGDDGPDPTPNKRAVMELVFNLDEARVHFTKTIDGKERSHWVFFVRGNAPEEVVCDYSYAQREDDNFGPTLDKMVDETVANWQAMSHAKLGEAYLDLLEAMKTIEKLAATLPSLGLHENVANDIKTTARTAIEKAESA